MFYLPQNRLLRFGCSSSWRRLRFSSSSSADPIVVRLVSLNDVYDMGKLPRLAHLLSDVKPSAVTLSGDFLSPSALSSIDNGRGHVAILRSAGITHVCLGNHEADLTLPVMKDRLDELGHRGRVVVVNSNVCGLGRHTKEYDIIPSNCGRVKIGLLGLLSDESDMFRDGTFRGLNIENTKDKYARMAEKMAGDVDCIVPMTHQTIGADVELANTILEMQTNINNGSTCGLILGGHEHQPILDTVSKSSDQSIHIVKTGQDADRVAIIDLNFDPSTHELQRVDIKFHEFTENDPACPIVQRIVDRHLSALDHMKEFIVLDTNNMFSNYFNNSDGSKLPLSSEYSRYQQTTVGAFFCSAIKSEVNADVCIINGAPIKASKVYTTGTMNYDELKSELPFPLKIVVVKMTKRQLKDAIKFSRTHIEEGKSAATLDDGRIERRGYLQSDFEWHKEEEGEEGTYIKDSTDDDKVLSVALPRNLLKGFCKIKPLMDLNQELKCKNALPGEDDYMKAVDLIVRFCCKDRWVSIANTFSFDELDINKDGILSREELRSAIKRVMGNEEPGEGLVQGMMDAIDQNASGDIDEVEFNNILAQVRRET